MKKIAMIMLVLLISNAMIAGSTYSVVYFKGSCEYKKVGKGWTHLQSKEISLDERDSVLLEDKAELILKDGSGKVVSFRTKGSYMIAAAVRSVKPTGGMTSELISYVFHEVKGHKEEAEHAATKQVTNIGGVSRGKVEPFLVSPLPNSLLSNNDVTFHWTGQKEGYVTFGLFRDQATKKQVFTKRLADSTLTISSKELPLDTGKVYYWKVTSLQQQNTDVWPFKLLAANDAASVKRELSDLESDLHFTEGVNHIIRAKFFERKQMLYDADLSFRNAIKSDPENIEFQTWYREFRDLFHPK